jgi:HAMP domain-containing protein
VRIRAIGVLSSCEASAVNCVTRLNALSNLPNISFKVHYGLWLAKPGKPSEKFQFSTMYSKGMPLRILNGQLRIADKAYDVQIAAPMDDFYDAVNRFRLVLLFSVPVLVSVASAGGYWLSRKAVAPVAEIARAAQSISEHELSKRLPILQTGDELQSLSESVDPNTHLVYFPLENINGHPLLRIMEPSQRSKH